MITEKHSKETILQLEILGWLLLIGEAVVSISFQLLYATTRTEQVVAVIYGIGIPLATVAFLKLAIIFNDKRFVFASFGLWALLFFWGWHTQYSYLLDETSSKADSSKVALVQNEQLNIIEEKLKNMPIAGAVFNDSIDKKIAAVESSLSKCPAGHATVCINPNQEKLQKLYAERDLKGVQAQIKNERNELLMEKQRALNAISGTDADIENAKTMSVYKGISWMINKLGGNYSPKEAEYLASIIGTFLYTVLSCTVWGFRTKFIMERESGGYIHSPALPIKNSAKVNHYVNSARENVIAVGQSLADKAREFKQHQNQVNALSESHIEKPFIGFVNTNLLPKVSLIKPAKSAVNDDLDTASMSVNLSERESLSTLVNAQTDTGAPNTSSKNIVSGGSGRGLDDLEPAYRVLVDSIKDGAFFKSESMVGVNSIKRVCKVGTAKAQVLLTMLGERGVSLERVK